MRADAICCNADGVQVRCLIVDDNQAFLSAATVLLEREGLTIVGVAVNGTEALRLADELEPDVVLVDISLGNESGLELTRRFGTGVILISTHDPTVYTDEIAASPALGFIPKAELSASAIQGLVDRR